jgi:hypothetical protein
MFRNEFLNWELLKPAIQYFTAGQAFLCGFAVVKCEKMSEDFAISFLFVVFFYHNFKVSENESLCGNLSYVSCQLPNTFCPQGIMYMYRKIKVFVGIVSMSVSENLTPTARRASCTGIVKMLEQIALNHY